MTKKIILITLLSIDLLMGGFVMSKGKPLIKKDIIKTATAFVDTETDFVNTTTDSTHTFTGMHSKTITFIKQNIPTTKFNVLDYGLKGDGVTDDSAALKELAINTSVTNWYFPKGKIFRLKNINVPPHVTALYGGGTLLEISGGGDKERKPPIFQGFTHNGYLVDGLIFKAVKYVGDHTPGGYGLFTISKEASDGDIKNIEVRNCKFIGTRANGETGKDGRNALSIIGSRERIGRVHHIWLHNNEILNNLGAGIEILNVVGKHPEHTDINNVTKLGIDSVKLNNNKWINGGWCGISIGRNRGNIIIKDEYIENYLWGIEINQNSGTLLKHNKIYNVRRDYISIGGRGWYSTNKDPYDDLYNRNKNEIYNNIMITDKGKPQGTIHIYSNSSSIIHGNYINGHILNQGGRSGDIYDNTIVTDLSIAPKMGQGKIPVVLSKTESQDFTGGKYISSMYNINFFRNKIYTFNNSNKFSSVYTGSSANNTCKIYNNKFYREGNGNCISGRGTPYRDNNKCNKNWSGAIPLPPVWNVSSGIK